MCFRIAQKCNYLKEVNNLEALSLYPKVVIFEDKTTIRILDVLMKDDKDHFIHKLDSEIRDRVYCDNRLWVLLITGTVVVFNLETDACIKVTFCDYFGSRLKQLRYDANNIIVTNESGENFIISSNDLIKDAGESNEFAVVLNKVNKRSCRQSSSVSNASINGLDISVEKENFTLKCSITGLEKTVISNKIFLHAVPWANAIVLVDITSMCIVDFKDATVLFEFDNQLGKYYPLGAYNNLFYYIVWNKSEIRLCYVWNSAEEHLESLEDNNCLNSSSSKLSSQEILKHQLNTLIQDIVPETKPDQVLAQIRQYFEKINDFSFLLAQALHLCQMNIAYKSILYLLQNRICLGDDKDMIAAIGDLIIKADLLEYIYFRGNKYYENVNLYEQNFKQLCIIFISNSDLDLAAICWLKYSEFKVTLGPDDVVDILNSVPLNIKLGALIIWLKNVVPSLLDENPFYIDLFVKWIMERVFELEKSGYWPKIGLKYIAEIKLVLEASLKTVSIYPMSMDDLDTLKDHIKYIMELKEKYKINMLLGELSSQSPNEVALIMLRRCYTEDLELFLHDYLPSYASRHLFDLDDTLRTFIENEAATSGGDIDGIRLKILLNALRSTTTKLDCLLQVLKVLDVPWNVTVLDLATTAAASVTNDFTVSDADCALAKEIRNELIYANVKVVLKKYNFPLSCTDYMLVLHKIVHMQTVNLGDLKVITSVMTNYSNYGHVLYISRCLQDCEIKTALDYYINLSTNEKKTIIKVITTKYEQIINDVDNNKLIERNYLDFLKGTKMLNQIQINDVENLYHLKNSYSIMLNINKMYNENYCLHETTTWIAKDEYISSSGRGGCVTHLTHTNLSRNSKIMSLLRRTSTSHSVRKLIENLIKYFTLEGDVSAQKEFVFSAFQHGANSPLLLDSSHVLVDLVINCSEEHLHYLINHLSALNALQNANEILKNLAVAWKFHYIFLPMSSVTGINDLIEFYSNLVHKNDSMTIDYSDRCDFIPFTMMATVMGIYVNKGQLISNDLLKMRGKIAKRLLQKVTTSQDLDEVLITALLLMLEKYEAVNNSSWILEILQRQNESLSPAIMCYLSSPITRHSFALDSNVPGSQISYPPQYILRSKFDINLGEVALPDSTEETWDVKVILFYVLKQNPETSFERLVDLCRTLNVSLNDGLSLQLISLLTTWELKYKVITDELNRRQIYFQNDYKDLTAKCLVIWENIKNKDFLKDILHDFWKNGEVTLHGRIVSINPYYYEVYMCIYCLIFGTSLEFRNKKEYFLLNFLKEYKRSSSPKQYEYELYSVKGMFPEIGLYRLPFQLFMREDMWSNLKSEITLETYELWLTVVALLSLDPDLQTARDMICSNAVKQTMTSRKPVGSTEVDAKETEPWKLVSREEPLLRAAHRCVRHIANMEWAGACLFYVLQGCARGADQVAAAQLCYQFAQRWAALQPGNRAVRQMERLHLTLSTRHALHKIQWACEELLRLTAEPAQLIRAIYLHPNFIEKMSRHDVNRTANEIADKNAINISSIRIQILENILDKSLGDKKSSKFLGLDTNELLTAKYILKATCPKMGAIYLSRIAFDDESDFNKCKKLRALQCLMSVVDADTAVKVTNKERTALWSSLLELIYIVKLENIDMPWVVATFIQNKILALEQLLQSANSKIDVLKVAAELASRFGNMQIIYNILKHLIRAGLFEEMIPLLLKASTPSNDIICAAWRAVILSPFQRADYPITEKQKVKCLNAINLLPVCPIVKDDDLKEVWKNCVRCKCFGMGCLILPYMTPESRQSLAELQRIDRRNLIASLKNLHTETYLVPGAMFVLENMTNKKYR